MLVNLRRAHSCAACAAKDQTITVLADQVDWLRAQLLQNPSVVRHSAVSAVTPSQPSPPSPAEWFKDEEEDVIAAIESGDMDNETAQRALEAIAAAHQTLSVVK